MYKEIRIQLFGYQSSKFLHLLVLSKTQNYLYKEFKKKFLLENILEFLKILKDPDPEPGQVYFNSGSKSVQIYTGSFTLFPRVQELAALQLQAEERLRECHQRGYNGSKQSGQVLKVF